MLRSYFAQKGGARSQGGDGIHGNEARVRKMSSGTCMREEEANSVRGPQLNDQIVLKGRVGKLGSTCPPISPPPARKLLGPAVINTHTQ